MDTAFVRAQKSPTMSSASGNFVLFFDEPPLRSPLPTPPSTPLPPMLARLLDAGCGVRRSAIMDSAIRGMGFDGLEYSRMTIVRGEPVPTAFCAPHGDAAWLRRYVARRYYVVDTRLHAALRSTLPSRWNLAEMQHAAASGRKNETAGKFLDAMHEAGLRSGVMFTLPGPRADERSVISLSSSRSDGAPAGDKLIARVLMLGMCLHKFYCRYADWPQQEVAARSELSERQNQILQGLARGYTDREIAETLDLSMHGVDYHLRRLRQHFDAHNRVELVQAAFRAGSL